MNQLYTIIIRLYFENFIQYIIINDNLINKENCFNQSTNTF